MVAQIQPRLMTPEEYLKWEDVQPIKYEYINGEVFAMTGGILPHNSIAVNLTSALKNHLQGSGCKVFMADAKVGISQSGPFHYPDVMVTCDQSDRTARKIIYHPILIVEVLSPSTEAFDRGRKFSNYRRLDTLKEYVLIDVDRMAVECYRRNQQGTWELSPYIPEETGTNGLELEIHLQSVDFHCPISLVYEDVVFPEDNSDSSEN